MELLNYILFFLLGLSLGGLLAWLVAKSRIGEIIQDRDTRISDLQAKLEQADASILKISEERSAANAKLEQMPQLEASLADKANELRSLNTTLTDLKEKHAALETVIEKERTATQEKLQLLEKARDELTDTFQALSANALRNSQESFLELAKATLAKYQEGASRDLELRQKEVKRLVEPVRESLEKFDEHVQEMERSRQKAYGGLSQQVDSLMTAQQQLHKETANLVKALRTPQVRGRWGELTLRRVAELAGMMKYCDFYEQETKDTEEGRLRPDMVVRLPNEKQIVVDSKAPLLAYLEALEAPTEEERANKLVVHSKQIQAHMNKLGQKSYWEQFHPTPEFVVLFIPGENFFSSALERNPGLIEEGVSKGVILATPTTLISLLKAVAFGWRQETMAENAQAISRLGKELHERLGTMAEHLQNLGKNIDKCVSTYNQVIGSFERRVLTSARRFNELGISGKDGAEIPDLSPTDKTTRQVSLPEPDEDA